MDHLQSIIAEYGVYFVFLGTLLEGETVVIMAGFLSHQGLLNPLGVVGAAFLGSWIASCLQSMSGATPKTGPIQWVPNRGVPTPLRTLAQAL